MNTKLCVIGLTPSRCRVAVTETSRSGSAKGSGFSRTPYTRLKIAVLAPMPSASVATTVSVKAGALARDFTASRSSSIMPGSIYFRTAICTAENPSFQW